MVCKVHHLVQSFTCASHIWDFHDGIVNCQQYRLWFPGSSLPFLVLTTSMEVSRCSSPSKCYSTNMGWQHLWPISLKPPKPYLHSSVVPPKSGQQSGALYCTVCAVSIANSTLLNWPIVTLMILFYFILFSFLFYFSPWLYSMFYWFSLLKC